MDFRILIVALIFRAVGSRDLSEEVEFIEGVKESKEDAVNWLKNQYRRNCGWQDTVRAVTALMLAGNDFGEYEKELYNKELDLAISLEMMRNPTISVNTAALYVNAIISSCRNPRNFYNKDLVDMIKKDQAGYHSAIAILALCNANATDSQHIDSLSLKLQNPDFRSRSMDEKALAFVAIGCLSKRGYDLYGLQQDLRNLQDEIEAIQEKDGGFGSVYRTALIVQGYLANGIFNDEVERAIKFLVSKQDEDGSFGNVVVTYLVLPIFYGKTLVNVSDVHCENDFCKDRLLPVQAYGASLRYKTLIYELWIRNDKYLTKSTKIKILQDEAVTIFDVMKIAAAQDNSFRLEYTGKNGKEEIYNIGGWNNDPELSYYWQCNFAIDNSRTIVPCNIQEQLRPEVFHIALWYKSSR